MTAGIICPKCGKEILSSGNRPKLRSRIVIFGSDGAVAKCGCKEMVRVPVRIDDPSHRINPMDTIATVLMMDARKINQDLRD